MPSSSRAPSRRSGGSSSRRRSRSSRRRGVLDPPAARAVRARAPTVHAAVRRRGEPATVRAGAPSRGPSSRGSSQPIGRGLVEPARSPRRAPAELVEPAGASAPRLAPAARARRVGVRRAEVVQPGAPPRRGAARGSAGPARAVVPRWTTVRWRVIPSGVGWPGGPAGPPGRRTGRGHRPRWRQAMDRARDDRAGTDDPRQHRRVGAGRRGPRRGELGGGPWPAARARRPGPTDDELEDELRARAAPGPVGSTRAPTARAAPEATPVGPSRPIATATPRRILAKLVERGPGVAPARELYGLTLYRQGKWRPAIKRARGLPPAHGFDRAAPGAGGLLPGRSARTSGSTSCGASSARSRRAPSWSSRGASWWPACGPTGRPRRRDPAARAGLEAAEAAPRAPPAPRLRAGRPRTSGPATSRRARELFGRLARADPDFADVVGSRPGGGLSATDPASLSQPMARRHVRPLLFPDRFAGAPRLIPAHRVIRAREGGRRACRTPTDPHGPEDQSITLVIGTRHP